MEIPSDPGDVFEESQDQDSNTNDTESQVSDTELDNEELLISAVQKWPMLFDQSSKKYRNAAHKREVWTRLSTEIGMDVDWCEKKWKSLRDSYVRKKRQLKTKSGQAARKVLLWKHFNAMKFMDNFIMEKQFSSTNLHKSSKKNFPNVASSSQTANNESTVNPGVEAEEGSADASPDIPGTDELLFPDPPETEGSLTKTEEPRYGKRKKPMDEFEKELLSTIKSTVVVSDEHHYFGMQIAEQLRSMNPMLSMVVKNRISSVILDLMYPQNTIYQVSGSDSTE